MRWSDFPRFPRVCYAVEINWRYVEAHLESEIAQGLDLDPDYQRAHVWTDEQRRMYLEHVIQGGETGRTLIAVTTKWNRYPTPNYSLLDGKQRLETVRMFMRNEIAIFGGLNGRSEGWRFEDIEGPTGVDQRFTWHVVEVSTRADVLRLYLKINAGGTPHTSQELDKVRAMLSQEKENK